MLRQVKLYGKLGNKFGRVHELDVDSCAEAIQALSVILPGFEEELLNSKDKGIGYACFVGKRNLKEENLIDLCGNNDIRIAPMVLGAKRAGLFTVILGAALFFVAPYVPQLLFSAGFHGATALAAGTASAALGKMLMLSGVVQLLSPQQRKLSTSDGPNNTPSNTFNGPVNTTAQGNPEPILYGELFIGSATIAGGMYSEDKI